MRETSIAKLNVDMPHISETMSFGQMRQNTKMKHTKKRALCPLWNMEAPIVWGVFFLLHLIQGAYNLCRLQWILKIIQVYRREMCCPVSESLVLVAGLVTGLWAKTHSFWHLRGVLNLKRHCGSFNHLIWLFVTLENKYWILNIFFPTCNPKLTDNGHLVTLLLLVLLLSVARNIHHDVYHLAVRFFSAMWPQIIKFLNKTELLMLSLASTLENKHHLHLTDDIDNLQSCVKMKVASSVLMSRHSTLR